MEVRLKVFDQETLDQMLQLAPDEFMVAVTGAVRRLVAKNARDKIGGDFGAQIARESIMTEEQSPDCHTLYLGGANGYIAEHIHSGGVVKPKHRRYLAIPIDRKVKEIYPREYGGELFVLRRKQDGPNGRAYLAEKQGKRGNIKPLWVLKRSVTHKPRPWWPDEGAITAAVERFFVESI